MDDLPCVDPRLFDLSVYPSVIFLSTKVMAPPIPLVHVSADPDHPDLPDHYYGVGVSAILLHRDAATLSDDETHAINKRLRTTVGASESCKYYKLNPKADRGTIGRAWFITMKGMLVRAHRHFERSISSLLLILDSCRLDLLNDKIC